MSMKDVTAEVARIEAEIAAANDKHKAAQAERRQKIKELRAAQSEAERKAIQKIIEQDLNIDIKIGSIKKITMTNYIKNLISYKKIEELEKYNLGLIYNQVPGFIQLVYYGNL